MRHLFWIVSTVVATFTLPPTATADEDQFPDVIGVSVSATSTLATSKKRYEPWYPLAAEVLNSRFWCEGKPDEGVGEALTIKLGTPTKLDGVTLSAGVWRSDELFRANNIVTSIEVATNDGRKKTVSLPEEMKPVEVVLGGAPIKELTLRITGVKKGRINDSCISGVELNTPRNSVVLVGVDGAQAAALKPTLAELWRAIDQCDENLWRKYGRFPLTFTEVVGVDKAADTKLGDARAAVKACKRFKFSSFHDLRHVAVKVQTEAPGRIRILDETLEWSLLLTDGHWQLTSLADYTP